MPITPYLSFFCTEYNSRYVIHNRAYCWKIDDFFLARHAYVIIGATGC